jgi:hypothetical protein
MKLSFTLSLFLGLVTPAESVDETFTDSYDDCLKFASSFDNTCVDQTTALDFASIPTGTVGCNLNGSYCPSHGTNKADGTCEFTRKLCVTCK